MRAPTMRTFSYIAATLVAASAVACAGDDNIGPVGGGIARGGAAGSSSISGSAGDKTISGNAGSPGAGGSGVAGNEGAAGSSIEIADASDAASVLGTEAGIGGRDLSTNRDLFFGDS